MRRVLPSIPTVCCIAAGCINTPTQTDAKAAWNMGRVDRFEIVDTLEPIDFAPIVVSNPDDVETLSAGYRDLEWKPYLATAPVDSVGYRLVGFRGDEEVVRRSIGPGGSFLEAYGAGTAQLTGEAKSLYVDLITAAKAESPE